MATRLPNADRAIVADRKITHYLLTHDHPRGRDKAAFFESFGFGRETWPRLRDALIDHAKHNPVVSSAMTPFGGAFEVNGPLATPDGGTPYVLVVWMIRAGEDFPRLLTAVPSRASGT